MDEYTRRTKEWLDQRFALYSEGVYIPNQPVYSFSKLAERLEEYARNAAILELLDRLAPRSFLDAGSADGYFPALVHRLYGIPVCGAELSEVACVRAVELFGQPAVVADVHALPFRDRAFDVTVCSEVLEHVVDPSRALAELLRVTHRALVITTPRARDPEEQRRHFESLDPNEPHAHIHYFLREELAQHLPPGTRFLGARSRLTGRLWDRIAEDIDGREAAFRRDFLEFLARSTNLGPAQRKAWRERLIDRYERRPGLAARLTGPGAVKQLLRLDVLLARRFPGQTHDWLLLAPGNGRTVAPGPARLGLGRLLEELLFNFHVPPLRRGEQP
jgi:SAM-dependent methyltransferase